MKSLIKKYKELIVAEPSSKNLDSSIDLYREAISNLLSNNKKSEPAIWKKNLGRENADTETIIIKWTTDKNFNLWHQDFPISKLDKKETLRLSNIKIALNYVTRYINQIEDSISENDYSFLMDTSFIIFHNAYFSWLDNLNKQTRDISIKIFLEYSNYLNNPTDAYQIKAMCYEAEGKLDLAKNYYYKSLMATSSDDNSFMAALQDYWSFLLEKGNTSEALELLLNIRKEKLIRDEDSYNDLLRSTFYIASKKRKKKFQSA
jgi:tetratricopeptide (TPR) repeat protein